MGYGREGKALPVFDLGTWSAGDQPLWAQAQSSQRRIFVTSFSCRLVVVEEQRNWGRFAGGWVVCGWLPPGDLRLLFVTGKYMLVERL